MTLDEAIRLIEESAERMNTLYGKPVFDERAIISLGEKSGRFLMYRGPRKEGFEKNFLSDVRPLRADLRSFGHNVGDFEFARHGAGTQFDAFMVLGEGVYLICNNTSQSMDAITKNPLWLGAQVPFVELSDAVRANPVVHSA